MKTLKNWFFTSDPGDEEEGEEGAGDE